MIMGTNKEMNVKQNTSIKSRESRESNLELLRILCMLLIIAHHCVLHGQAVSMSMSINRLVSLFILPGGKIGFICFLALSMWFLVDKPFKAERFIRVWLEVLFYSVLFLLISNLFGAQITVREWLGSFLPIAGNSHGFGATYLGFYLLIPLLSRVGNGLSKNQLKYIVLVLMYLEIGTLFVGSITLTIQPINSELLLFIFCYFLTMYLKKWSFKLQYKRKTLILIFSLIWISIWILLCFQAFYPENRFIAFLVTNCSSETSIIYILGGYTLFFIFNTIKIKPSVIINRIAATTFGILLMHDHNYFRAILWNNIFKVATWYDSRIFILRIILVVLIIFSVGAIFDWFRLYFIEKPIFKLNKVKLLFNKIDEFLA